MANFIKNKKAEHFKSAMLFVVVSIAVVSIAFMSESDITGLVVENDIAESNNLMVYEDVNSLGTLASGNYYIDSSGIVYWMDDEATPAIAKVKSLSEAQKNRQIYIDKNGNVGYLIQ